jgi:hypothetical protein
MLLVHQQANQLRSTMSPFRKIAAVGATMALLGTAGLGVANAADQSATGSSTTGTTRPGPGPRGGHELTSAQLQSIAAKLGVTTTQLQAAIAANRPARPSGARPDRGDGMAAELASALGADATKVAAILEANRPARPAAGTTPAKPDESALIAALAKGLSVDQSAVTAALAKVRAAHEAEHEARDNARYAALAKTLGVDTSAVKAAFEAVRPARPAGR